MEVGESGDAHGADAFEAKLRAVRNRSKNKNNINNNRQRLTANGVHNGRKDQKAMMGRSSALRADDDEPLRKEVGEEDDDGRGAAGFGGDIGDHGDGGADDDDDDDDDDSDLEESAVTAERREWEERSVWRRNLLSWANADSLAYFVNLGRFVCSAIVTLFCE